MAPGLTSTSDGGNATAPKTTFEPGIYVPTVAFFKPDEELDLETTKTHAARLGSTGIKGIVTHGSNGEAAHLTHDERIAITKATRAALDESGNSHVRIIVGCGAHSTRETILYCKEAAAAGGEAALVLPPSYFASLLTPKLLLDHYRNVADASPIPIFIYNFPAVQSGLDLTSDHIIELAQHPKIIGVKLTCGNTGKLARIAAATVGTGFLTMGGASDFLLQTLVAGGQGVIAGTGNLAPKANVRAMELYQKGDVKQAQKIQTVLAHGDWVSIKGGFVAVKVGLQKYHGYGGLPRLPCALPELEAKVQMEDSLAEMMELEETL